MEAVPAYYQTLFQADPLAGAIGTLALATQMEIYLTEGAGRDRFGPLQPVAVQAARKIRADVVDRIRLVARRKDAFDGTQSRIDAWARENPIAGTSLASRPSIVPFLMKMADSEDRDVFGVVGDIGGSVADIATRLDIYSGYLPKAARWQSELLGDELVARDEVRLAISTLESMAKLMKRVDALTSTESIDSATAFGLSSVHTELLGSIGAFDRMKADVLAYFTGERQTLSAIVDVETRTVLADIDRQRELTMGQADDLRRKAFVAADQMRSQTVADIEGLANRIILKVALTFAALLVLATPARGLRAEDGRSSPSRRAIALGGLAVPGASPTSALSQAPTSRGVEGRIPDLPKPDLIVPIVSPFRAPRPRPLLRRAVRGKRVPSSRSGDEES
jgi:hypothetical protein